MDYQAFQSVSCLSPDGRWNRLQPLCDPELDLAVIENGWMNG